MRIALVCNERPLRNPPGFPDDAFEEYDTPATLAAIAKALEAAGAEVERVAADRRLPWRLDEGRFDFVFNVAEGEGRRCREAVPAAVYELLGIPFTGPDALTLAVTLDKAMARRIVSPDIPVAAAVLWEGPSGDGADLDALSYPVVVKPNDEGSSKGIRASSVVRDARAAAEACRRLSDRYGCPVLVEEFLPGAEITVGVVGNGPEARVLGMMEIAASNEPPAADDLEPFVYSLDVKRDYLRRVTYHQPPRVPLPTRERTASFALEAYRRLGCRDAARVDFRLDAAGVPRFLECNALPGLDPANSDLVILSRPVIEYGDLVRGILIDAARRFSVRLTAAIPAATGA